MKKLPILILAAILCALVLAGCGKTTWTVDIAGQTSQLSTEDAAALERLLKLDDWRDGLTDCARDAILTSQNRKRIDYSSGCGTLNDLENQRHLELDDSAQENFNFLLSQYGMLGIG